MTTQAKKGCKYEGCPNHRTRYYSMYCCDACSDADEDAMLIEEEKKLEKTREKLSKCALDYVKQGGLNYGLELDKETLKGLAYYIKWHMTESTTLNEAINEMMQDFAANLKDEPGKTLGDAF